VTETPTSTQPAEQPADSGVGPTVQAKKSAQDLFNEAKGFSRKGDLIKAMLAFQSVARASDADPNLRKDAQNHIDELTWLKEANSALNRQDAKAARALYEKVVNLNLEHAPEARNSIQQIDSGNKEALYRAQINGAVQSHDYLGARQKLNDFIAQGGHDSNGELSRQIETSENQWFGELQSQFERAKAASDVDQLQGLRSDFEKVANGGGLNATRAKSIVESAIPNAVSEINKKNQLEATWNQTVAVYKTALDTKNRSTLVSLKDQLQQFLSSQHTAEAQQYIARINEILSSAPPPAPKPDPNPPVKPSSNLSAASDEADIRQVFNSLSKVFDDRSVTELKGLWPQIEMAALEDYRKSFEEKSLKSLARKYVVSSVNITNDSATASGIWTGVHSRNGRLLMNDQVKWSATLRKVGGRWVISSLKNLE
jgi:hypothetical protein